MSWCGRHNYQLSRVTCRRRVRPAVRPDTLTAGHAPRQRTADTARLSPPSQRPLRAAGRRSLDHLEERYGEDHAEQHDAGDADADAAEHDGVVLDELLDARLAADPVGVLLGAGQRGARRTARGGHRDDAPPPVGRPVHSAALHLPVRVRVRVGRTHAVTHWYRRGPARRAADTPGAA